MKRQVDPTQRGPDDQRDSDCKALTARAGMTFLDRPQRGPPP